MPTDTRESLIAQLGKVAKRGNEQATAWANELLKRLADGDGTAIDTMRWAVDVAEAAARETQALIALRRLKNGTLVLDVRQEFISRLMLSVGGTRSTSASHRMCIASEQSALKEVIELLTYAIEDGVA